MKRRRKNGSLTREGAWIQSRVKKTRGRAKFVGLIYLFSIILLAVVACFPLFDLNKQENAPVGITAFWKAVSSPNAAGGRLALVNAGLYGLMLFIVFINVCRAFGKLNWLFKWKVSKSYGLNRNVYAMEDLGKIFSGTFSVILLAYYFMLIVCGQAYLNVLMYLTTAVCVLVHFFAGVIGGKSSYFKITNGKIEEEARILGRFSVFFRNILQITVVFLLMTYFQKISTVHTIIRPLLEPNGIQNYLLSSPSLFLSIVLQGFGGLCFIPLTFHAFGTTEYNIDGTHGAGMKTFRIFTFLAAAFFGMAAMCQYTIGQVVFTVVDGATSMGFEKVLSKDTLVLAAIAFVMFLIEVIMRNMPSYEDDNAEEDDDEDDEDDDEDDYRVAQQPIPYNPSVVLHIYND